MDEKVEGDSYSGTNVVTQLLSTNASTLALMTTTIVLFVTLVAKRISSTQTEVNILMIVQFFDCFRVN